MAFLAGAAEVLVAQLIKSAAIAGATELATSLGVPATGSDLAQAGRTVAASPPPAVADHAGSVTTAIDSMPDPKPAWQSSTIIAGAVGVVVSGLSLVGIGKGWLQANDVMAVVAAGATLCTSLAAIYGRFKASRPIG